MTTIYNAFFEIQYGVKEIGSVCENRDSEWINLGRDNLSKFKMAVNLGYSDEVAILICHEEAGKLADKYSIESNGFTTVTLKRLERDGKELDQERIYRKRLEFSGLSPKEQVEKFNNFIKNGQLVVRRSEEGKLVKNIVNMS